MFPLVSVIVPVYNVKSYLRESIDSILNQTYKNFEIIIVDDGSTDGSELICNEYKKIDNRIHVIHQKNTGLSGARNIGLDTMKGEIVAFLDSDDAFLPDFLQVMVETMINCNADIVVCEFITCYTTERMDNTCRRILYRLESGCYSPHIALQRMIDHKINHAVWNKIFNSKLFKIYRFPIGYNYEDSMLIPLLFEKANSIKTIAKPLIYYRKRPNSITTTSSAKNISDYILCRKIRERFISDRIPDVFTIKQKERYKEESLLSYIFLYLDMVLLSEMSRSKVILKKEIYKGSAYVSKCRLKTKVLFYLFKMSPFLCYVLHRCYKPIGTIVSFIISHLLCDTSKETI